MACWAELAVKLRSHSTGKLHIEALTKLARAGRQIQPARSAVPHIDAIAAIASAGLRLANERYSALQTLVEDWNKRFAPIRDPLMLDFGLNRWLSSEREEAYSDWIAWILQEVGRKHAEWLLLGVESSPREDHCKTDREVWVPEGHNGQAGRLDCVVFFNDTVIVMELKTGDARTSDTAKHEGYAKWLNTRHEQRKVALLIAKDAKEIDEFGFQPLPW
jgi:hypothetical protein